jgi:hypothetical protein
MRRRAIIPFLCAGALMLAAAPGFARVGVVVGVATPTPVVEPVPAPPGPGYVQGAGAPRGRSGGGARGVLGVPDRTK